MTECVAAPFLWHSLRIHRLQTAVAHNLVCFRPNLQFISAQMRDHNFKSAQCLFQRDLLCHRQVCSYALKQCVFDAAKYNHHVAIRCIWNLVALTAEHHFLRVFRSPRNGEIQSFLLFIHSFTFTLFAFCTLRNRCTFAITPRTFSLRLYCHRTHSFEHDLNSLSIACSHSMTLVPPFPLHDMQTVIFSYSITL